MGGLDHRIRSTFHFLAEDVCHAGTVGHLRDSCGFWLRAQPGWHQQGDNTEGGIQLRRNNDCRFREIELKMPVSQHGGDMGKQS